MSMEMANQLLTDIERINRVKSSTKAQTGAQAPSLSAVNGAAAGRPPAGSMEGRITELDQQTQQLSIAPQDTYVPPAQMPQPQPYARPQPPRMPEPSPSDPALAAAPPAARPLPPGGDMMVRICWVDFARPIVAHASMLLFHPVQASQTAASTSSAATGASSAGCRRAPPSCATSVADADRACSTSAAATAAVFEAEDRPQ